jgi:hypothetical protein
MVHLELTPEELRLIDTALRSLNISGSAEQAPVIIATLQKIAALREKIGRAQTAPQSELQESKDVSL